MTLELTSVDAFTSQPFTGNPAAIAIVDEFPDPLIMQAVAREMNPAETAFVAARADDDFDLRWFTPTVEVDLCGHATLAAAHLLGGTARFHTRSGLLACTRTDDGWIEMDFPSDPPARVDPPADLDLPGLVWFGRGVSDGLAVLDDPASVRTLVARSCEHRQRRRASRDRDCARRSPQALILSAGSSGPMSVFPRTRSQARRTARWPSTGANTLDDHNLWVNRPHRGAASFE